MTEMSKMPLMANLGASLKNVGGGVGNNSPTKVEGGSPTLTTGKGSSPRRSTISNINVSQ